MDSIKCPKCGSDNIRIRGSAHIDFYDMEDYQARFTRECEDCGEVIFMSAIIKHYDVMIEE